MYVLRGLIVIGIVLACAGIAPDASADEVTLLWSARHAGRSGTAPDVATAVVTSPDGSTVFVTGRERLWYAGECGTVAYDARSGRRLWWSTFTLDTWDWHSYCDSGSDAFSLAVSPDGERVFVAGSACGTDPDYVTVAYEAATGRRLWLRRYDGAFNWSIDTAHAIAVGPDGATVFVTGASYGVGTSFDYATLAYDALTGEQLWVARHDGPATIYDRDEATALAVSHDGATVYVTGHSTGDGTGADYLTLAYDAVTGAPIWSRRYAGEGGAFATDMARSVAVSPDDATVFVMGDSEGGDDEPGYVVVAYDAASGADVWTSRVEGGPSGMYREAVYTLGVSADGREVFMHGDTLTADGSCDFATVAMATSSGESMWASGYDGPASGIDMATALAASPDDSTVIVAGPSEGLGTGDDYATLAYDVATGETMWTARYDGPRSSTDIPHAVAVGPQGTTFFVTGYSVTNDSGGDYATVAYGLLVPAVIDVAPGDPFNTVSACLRRSLPVAILGSAELDVTDIDTTTLRFGPAESATEHDLTNPGSLRRHLADVNQDGYPDLLVHFLIGNGAVAAGPDTVTLSGRMGSGRFIEATDSVTWLSCGGGSRQR